MIGDLHTVALVGTDGVIDFACFPQFDSPSVFASLLDREKGGYFSIQPVESDESGPGRGGRQMYLPDTNVLLTRFQSGNAIVEISDFMPIETQQVHDLVRRVKAIRGEARIRVVCAPRFDYARASHRIERVRDGVLFSSDGMALRLRSTQPLEIVEGDARADFVLQGGESASFILEEAHPGEESPSAAEDYVSESFKATANFWRTWLKGSSYKGRWLDMVNRSALTLKLLTSLPHGSIIAAPTFGLPEFVGGSRNWDYRYTWIRDATFTLYALMRLGFTSEAEAFLGWIEDRCAELTDGSSLQVLYRTNGGTDVDEQILDHFEGYRGSRPVRIGNGAQNQLQLDIYGELMDAVYLYDKLGSQISIDLWNDLTRVVDWVCDNWRRPGEGIWESRAGQEEFLYSRVLCWVAVDRGIRLATKRGVPAPLDRWLTARNQMHRDVFENFWNAKRGCLVQRKGSDAVDAANLLLPLLKFIGPRDPRWLGTLRAIEEDLVEDALVYRYRLTAFSDGLSDREGSFLPCSFWYAECLARSGDLQQARLVFEKALTYSNHVGLFSEEIGPHGEQIGNFPQALTHLALISAAFDINRRLSESTTQDI